MFRKRFQKICLRTNNQTHSSGKKAFPETLSQKRNTQKPIFSEKIRFHKNTYSNKYVSEGKNNVHKKEKIINKHKTQRLFPERSFHRKEAGINKRMQVFMKRSFREHQLWRSFFGSSAETAARFHCLA